MFSYAAQHLHRPLGGTEGGWKNEKRRFMQMLRTVLDVCLRKFGLKDQVDPFCHKANNCRVKTGSLIFVFLPHLPIFISIVVGVSLMSVVE